MTWFHWSTDQFWWSLAHTESVRSCLNDCIDFEIDILLSYPSWWSLRTVVNQETAKPALFQALEFSPSMANRLEIKSLLSWRSSHALCFGFGTVVGLFWTSLSYLRDGDWKHVTWTTMLFWVLSAFHNTWKMAFCISKISLIPANCGTGW